jgi:spermidine synthase
MKRPTLLGKAAIPGSDSILKLYQGKDDCRIVISGRGELMSTRKHASEDALGTLSCQMLKEPEIASVLIGGLGMGFTLAAVLAATGAGSRVVVAELVPEVVEWNKGALGSYSGYPLSDSRTTIYQGDVIDLLRSPEQRYDVIALDVDNGPEALSSSSNEWLYSPAGIGCASECLKPDGVLAYWSATPDISFAKRLRACGLRVSEKSVFAHGSKGTKHTIWLANT